MAAMPPLTVNMIAADVFREFGAPYAAGLHHCKPEIRDAVEHCLDRIHECHTMPMQGGYTREWLKAALHNMELMAMRINEQVTLGRCDPEVMEIDVTIAVD